MPVCFVFHNPITGETIEQFYRAGDPIPPCPIGLGPDTLLVAFTATAELTTMLRCGAACPLAFWIWTLSGATSTTKRFA